ncbi:MAG: ATP-binding protein [Alphaproteobacteria bacterium]|nr:ATP-binding protein [Alphaproteobacteria bacterium]MBN2674965.1 ATP-binding protein [Alphaproteobacteria bacterium]
MRLIPRSFLWRTVLMVLVPLIIAQVIVANVFFGNHWTRVHATMARSLSGEIATMVNLMDAGETSATTTMGRDTGINFSVNQKLNRPENNDNNARETGMLAAELSAKVKRPATIYMDKGKRLVFVDVPTKDGQIATFATSLYRIYSTSTDVFILWLIGSILIVLILISPFVIIHTRSIRRIAKAASNFGRGLDAPGFVPSGSKEIREAAIAMIKMKERLNRYNRTRTDMLNAVSHDLKAPLARMRLGIETDDAAKNDLLHDIDRMAEMINGYLAFARGEMPEIEQTTELPAMLIRIARDAAGDKKIETDFPDAPVQFYARPMALARAFGNIIENAARYAKKKIKITEKDSEEQVEIIIEDDGHGIPDDKKSEALRPFVRLDESRGNKTGGTGLGLSIAQTAFENHGGQMFLEDSDLGGLRVRIILPL